MRQLTRSSMTGRLRASKPELQRLPRDVAAPFNRFEGLLASQDFVGAPQHVAVPPYSQFHQDAGIEVSQR